MIVVADEIAGLGMYCTFSDSIEYISYKEDELSAKPWYASITAPI